MDEINDKFATFMNLCPHIQHGSRNDNRDIFYLTEVPLKIKLFEVFYNTQHMVISVK